MSEHGKDTLLRVQVLQRGVPGDAVHPTMAHVRVATERGLYDFVVPEAALVPASKPSEDPGWRWLRLRSYLRQWLNPDQFRVAMDCLDKAAAREQRTLADYCERCKAGQRREYRTVVMPEPYGGTGWWHWSPDAEWPNSSEKGAWFTCAVQSAPPVADTSANTTLANEKPSTAVPVTPPADKV